MQGSIQKKGNAYYAIIAVGGKRKWFKGGNTKKDAQRVLNEKLHDINQGTYKEIIKTRFKEYCDVWITRYAESHVKASTLRSYKDIIKRLFIPSFGDYSMSELTECQLQSYISRRSKEVSSKTVCNEVVVMKEMFKHAFRWGYLKVNPAEYVERPKIVKPEIEILTPDEMGLLLQNSEGHYHIAFLTAFLTGLRAGELWALEWGDIDWLSKQIFVRRSLWKGNFQAPKSRCSVRKIDITPSLAQELKRWKLASPVNEHDLVFPSPEGSISIHENVVKRYYNPALRRAGLRQVSFHSMRHTNASMRIASGQNIKYIQTQLGHASISITLDVYGHLFNDANFNRQQAELLEVSFNSVRNPLENTLQNKKNGLQNLVTR